MDFQQQDRLNDIQGELRRFLEYEKYQQRCQADLIHNYNQQCLKEIMPISKSQLLYDEVRDVLGSGAYGKVVRGKYCNAPVAIKILNKDTTSARDMARELLKEAQVMQRIRHPFVVLLYGIVNEVKEKCLVMELALGSLHDLLYSKQSELQDRGMDPSNRLRRSGSVSGSKYLLNFNLALLADCASALDFLHSINVLHRDVKPANVLIFQGLQCKLCDFGLCKIKDEVDRLTSTITGGVKGTPIYMAPELFNRVKSTYASDVYSFGIMVRHVFALGC